MLTQPSQSSSSRFGEFGCIVVLKRDGKDGSVFKINYETVRIGKNDAMLDIRVQNDAVSSIHCLLEVNKDTKKILCKSCNPENPAVLNGEFVSVQGKILSSGDIIRIGTRNFRFEYNNNWTQGLGKPGRSRSSERSQKTLDTDQPNTYSQPPSLAASSADLIKSETVTSSFLKEPKISTSILGSIGKREVKSLNEELKRRPDKETHVRRKSFSLKIQKLTTKEVENAKLDPVFAESTEMFDTNLAKGFNKRKSAIAARKLKQISQKVVSGNRLSLPVITSAKDLSVDNIKQSSKASRTMLTKRENVSLTAGNSGGSHEESVKAKEPELCLVTSTASEEVKEQNVIDEPRSIKRKIKTNEINEPFIGNSDVSEDLKERSLSSKNVSRTTKVAGETVRKSSDVESGWRLTRRSFKDGAGNSEPTIGFSQLSSESQPASVVDTNTIANNCIDLLDIDLSEQLDNQDCSDAYRSSCGSAKKTSSLSDEEDLEILITSSLSNEEKISEEDYNLNSCIEPLSVNQRENPLMESQDSIYNQRLSRGSIHNRLSFREEVTQEDNFLTNRYALLDVDQGEYLPVVGQHAVILPSSSEAEVFINSRKFSSSGSEDRQHISDPSLKNLRAENVSTMESTFHAEDISVLESQNFQSNFELQNFRNTTFNTDDVSMISILGSCSSSSHTVKDKVRTCEFTLEKKEVVVASADSTTPQPPSSSRISGTKPYDISVGQDSVRSTIHSLRSFPASGIPGIPPGLSRVQTRRSVSFGPKLSPEYVDSRLPPSTPIKRGTKPLNLFMTGPRLVKKRGIEISSTLIKRTDKKPLSISKKKVNVTEGSVDERRNSSVGGKKLFSEVLKAAKTPKVKRLQRVTLAKSYSKTDKPKQKTILHDERKVVNLGHMTPRSKPATTGHANSPVTYVIGKRRSFSQENIRLESSKKQKRESASLHCRESEGTEQTLVRKGTQKADYQCVQGIEEFEHLLKDCSQVAGGRSKRRQSTPKADYRNTIGLKRLLHPPKSPDYSKVEGVRSFLRQRTPKADYRNVKGLKELLHPSKSPDYSKVEGVCSVLRQHTPEADYRNVKGLKELMHPPKSPDYSKVDGVRSVLRHRTPKADYRNVKGLKELMHPPKSPDYSKVKGLRSVLRQHTPKANYRNVRGLKELVHPPKESNFENISAVKRFLRGSTPRGNYQDLEGVKELMQSPMLKQPKPRDIPGGGPNDEDNELDSCLRDITSARVELEPIKIVETTKATNKDKEVVVVPGKRMMRIKRGDSKKEEIENGTSRPENKKPRVRRAKATEGHDLSTQGRVSPAEPSPKKTRSNMNDRPKTNEKKASTKINEEMKATNKGKEVQAVPNERMARNDATQEQVSSTKPSLKKTRSNKEPRGRSEDAKESHNTNQSPAKPLPPKKSPKKTGSKKDIQSELKEKAVSTIIVETTKATNKDEEVIVVPRKRTMRIKRGDSKKEEIENGTTTSRPENKKPRVRRAKATEDHDLSTRGRVSPAEPSHKKTRSNMNDHPKTNEKKASTKRALKLDVVSTQSKKTVRIQTDNDLGNRSVSEEVAVVNTKKEVLSVQSRRVLRNKSGNLKKINTESGVESAAISKVQAKTARGRKSQELDDEDVSSKDKISAARPSSKKTRSKKVLPSEPKKKEASKRSAKEERHDTPPRRTLRTRR